MPGALVLRDLLVAVPSYREMWAAVWAHHAAGDLPATVTAACELETALSGWSGESDATITVLIARAWLTLCRRADWHGTRELFIATALRCRAAQHRPKADMVRTAGNVHAVWHLLGEESPEAAADLAGPPGGHARYPRRDDRRADVLAREQVAAASAG